MTNIESNKAIINRSDFEIFNFLSDFTHFSNLMPEQITNWQATTDTCSFTIQAMASISMKIDERIPYSEIRIKSDTSSPIEFTMHCLLNKISDNATQVNINFIADLPPMIKMMATKPLKNFVDLLVVRLKEFAENGGF